MGINYLVELEFKRVQTFLFAVPRLKDMIGANTILGETIRGVWDKKGNEYLFISNISGSSEYSIDNLPALAVSCGSKFPKEETYLYSLNEFKILKEAINSNQINEKFNFHDVYQDDVLAVAFKTGIIVRDGGHFLAFFPDKEKAEAFQIKAKGLISQKLPGLIIEARVKPYDTANDNVDRIDSPKTDKASSIFDLPQFEDCEISGTEPAASIYKKDGICEYIGEASLAKREAADRFYEKNSKDVIGILLNSGLIDKYDREHMDFSDIGKISENHIAVIHADGNDVGKNLSAIIKDDKEKYLYQWLKTENFFYRIRSGVRKAFMTAIEKNEIAASNDKNKLLIMPLMLGGDDILVVTPASVAFDFVSVLAEAVKINTDGVIKCEKGTQPLTIGCGILICKSSFPFFKAYELSEELASSAKKLKNTAPGCSYVDWEILSESWHSGVEKARRSQYVAKKNNEKLIFSGKPYIISDEGDCTFNKLIEASKNKELLETSARSQFKFLYERIPEGRNKFRLLFDELPEGMNKLLKLQFNDESFRSYKSLGEDVFITRVGDFIEILETSRRGNK